MVQSSGSSGCSHVQEMTVDKRRSNKRRGWVMNMKVVFLRANAVNPDPRVEKEMRALSSNGVECLCVGWDRSSSSDEEGSICLPNGKKTRLHLIGVPSRFGSGMRNAPNILRFERRLYTWLINNTEKYDVVHACDLDTGFIAKAACGKTGKPFVYDIFDFYSDSRIMPDIVKKLVKRLELGVIDRARATIVCTEQRIGQIADAKPNQVVVIENTPEMVDIPKEEASDSAICHLAYVGILAKDRYLDRLLDVVDRYDDLVLEMGGFGPLEAEIAKRAEQNSRIVFHGKVPYCEALKIESRADVMFGLYNPEIANHKMAAPNKYYESLMLGTPLIAIEGTSVAYWVEEGRTGAVLRPSFSCEDLHDAIERILSENRDRSISLRQKELYQKKHSWHLMAERLCALYSTIGAECDGGARR